MNLERLPQIVEAVKPTMPINGSLWKLRAFPGGVAWETDHAIRECFPLDAANACVVAMLGRLVANGNTVTINGGAVCVLVAESGGRQVFPGNLLNALYDAFTAHPEWFKEAP